MRLIMRGPFLANAVLALALAQAAPTFACDLVHPNREPTLAEKVGGLKVIFGGTVIGYKMSDGTKLVGPLPSQCLDDAGDFPWWEETLLPECAAYLQTEAALFRVDAPIVGPASNEVVEYGMTWGDGDCNIDFEVGEKWLVAGAWFTQELHAPIRESEVAMLRRLAAGPPFDFSKLYP
jgi:hypothetical protein